MTHRSCLMPIIGFCLLTACSWESSVYHHFVHPTCQPWTKCDTLHFADTLYFEKEEAPGYLILETMMRHSDLYPYEDIYLNADITVGFTEESITTADDTTAIDNNQANAAEIQTETASRSSQTFHLLLVNSRHHWSGKGWGSLHTAGSTPYTISLSEKFYHQAPPAGNDPSDTTHLQLPFHISIASAMQDATLNGIESIGLRLHTK